MDAKEAIELTVIRALCKSGNAREVRLTAGLSLAEVGEVVGVDQGTVSRWEHGRRRPRGSPALRYARLLSELVSEREATS